MGKSTISDLITEVCTSLWSNLRRLHMPRPTSDSLMDIAQEYYLVWDMPHCVGAIDVRHIRIRKPAGSGSLYYNYKKFFSITLQAVVDAHYKFIAIDVGGYGHQHDATTFRHSNLYKALKTKKIKFPEDDELYDSRTVLPYFLIGDGAYPLSRNIMKPHPGKGLSKHKRLFNKRLSRARMSVECGFGRLCQKFRIFYKPMEYEPEKAKLIVKGSCILHNVIIDREKPTTILSPQFMNESSILEGDERETDEVLTGDGEIVRRQLMRFFLKNPIERQ